MLGCANPSPALLRLFRDAKHAQRLRCREMQEKQAAADAEKAGIKAQARAMATALQTLGTIRIAKKVPLRPPCEDKRQVVCAVTQADCCFARASVADTADT